MKQTKPKQSDEEVRALILAGARAEALRLRCMVDDLGHDIPVRDLSEPGHKFALRAEFADGKVRLGSTRSYDSSFLLFGGGGLLVDVKPDRSVAAVADLLERSPDVLADASTRVDKERFAAQDRLVDALESLPLFGDGSSPDVTGSTPPKGGDAGQAGEQRT
jgi:hypothetical protein